MAISLLCELMEKASNQPARRCRLYKVQRTFPRMSRQQIRSVYLRGIRSTMGSESIPPSRPNMAALTNRVSPMFAIPWAP